MEEVVPQAGLGNMRKKTLCVTFDNLGEAAEIEFGLLPPDTPTGDHVSANAMPRILDVLNGNDIQATFFFEGWNANAYPNVLERVVEGGHELALHGWRHENWAEVEPEREKELLDRSFKAFRELGLDPVGFRPPGGGITQQIEDLLTEQGATHISPAAHIKLHTNKLANIPFAWKDVDAFWFEPLMAPLREAVLGEGKGGVAPLSVWDDNLSKHLNPAAQPGEVRTLIFHPYMLALDEDRMKLFERFIGDLAGQDDLATARCADVAARQGISPGQ